MDISEPRRTPVDVAGYERYDERFPLNVFQLPVEVLI